jgi:hypothetical protein
MGTSNWQNISYCIELIRRINPDSILDIGAGFGRWGILSREFLDVWDDGNYTGEWKRRIDAVEIFDNYVKPYHSYFYDNVFREDAIGFVGNCKDKYDLIICGDVIEHFQKEEGKKFIDSCLRIGKHVMINIPVGDNWEQAAINDNKHEIHRSVWQVSDFSGYRFKKIKTFRDYIQRKFIVVLISGSEIDLKSGYRKRYGKHIFKKNFLENRLGLKWLVKFLSKKKHN